MIEVSHLKKTYNNGLQVLRDVNATIEKGEVISIIGIVSCCKKFVNAKIAVFFGISATSALY